MFAIIGILILAQTASAEKLRVEVDKKTGAAVIRDGQDRVLQYNYHTVEPPEGYREKIKPNSLKYAQPRSNYIHPLYGPNGESLTADWNMDHPHHRGIYWAWPEVKYEGQLADLHALQKVFARPTGKLKTRDGDDYAEIAAENRWLWNDKTPIVRELATIRAYPIADGVRIVDLQFDFTALVEGVTVARRRTKLYGGLNIRLAPIAGLKLSHHADPPESQPRQAWQYATGTWAEAKNPATLVALENAANPHYPGDYIKYPNLPWFQPTFPRAGIRHAIPTDKPLTLRYRLLIMDGGPPEADAIRKQFSSYNTPATTSLPKKQETSR